MKQIAINGHAGVFALVSDDDYDYLSKFKWFLSGGYAIRFTPTINGRRKTVRMNREILYLPRGLFTDHIDGNRLNNQRENIRASTVAENNRNGPPYKTNKLGIRGVCCVGKRFRAQILYNHQRLHLGYFDTSLEAASARQAAEIKYHGEFSSHLGAMAPSTRNGPADE